MDGELRDLGSTWLDAGHAGKTIRFDRIDLHMIARAGEGDYSSSRALSMEDEYMVTFELDEERFCELLELLPSAGAAQLRSYLGGPFTQPQVVNIPPEVIFVGFRARLGEPREAPDETYVPLIVTEVFEPGPIMSIDIEDVA